MSDYNSQYDPHIPKNGGGAGGGSGRTQDIHAQIGQTTDILRDNINKVAERGERLESMTDKTDALNLQAQGFRKGANGVRKRMWWKDFKMRIIIGVGILVVLLLIIIPIVVRNK